MRIENFRIDHFGNQSDRYVDGFADRLHILYTPQEETKQTVIQFVRWMLYGNSDTTSQDYLRRATETASGSITVVHGSQRRSIARRDDGSRYGRLAVDGGDHYSPQTNHMVSLLGNVNQSDFDCLFAPQLNSESHLMGLLESARLHGLDIPSRPVECETRDTLRRQIDALRCELQRFGEFHESVRSLQARREQLISDISRDDVERRDRESQLAAELTHVESAIGRLRDSIETTRQRRAAKDEEAQRRRRLLEAAWQQAEDAKRQFVDRMDRELDEYDRLIGNWQESLNGMRQRRERIWNRLSEDDRETAAWVRDRGVTCAIAPLADRLDRIRDQIATGSYAQTPHNSVAARDASSTPLHRDLSELRDAVTEVCQLLHTEYDRQQHVAFEVESEQLENCDTSLTRWLENLEQQRDRVQRARDTIASRGVALHLDDPTRQAPYGVPHYQSAYDIPDGHIRAVHHTCAPYEPPAPDADALLRRLSDEHSALTRELESLERQLAENLEQRQRIADELSLRSVRRLEDLRHELATVETQLNLAEQREQREADLRILETELHDLREVRQSSAIAEHAADLLSRITAGRFSEMRIDQRNEIWLLGPQQSPISWRQADDQLRHDAHLCLCLAVVAACRRAGIEMPLLLDDVFTHIDASHDEALVSVLSHFASAGHQVLLLTRHRHVPELFENREYRLISLERTAPVERPVISVDSPADPVRFRRRTSGDRSTSGDRTATVIPTAAPRAKNRVTPAMPETPPITNRRENLPIAKASHQVPQTVRWETPIEHTAVVDADVAARLRAIGIVSVRDFLELPVDDVNLHLHSWGMTARPIRRWQDELELCCWLPAILVDDASLLVACGINDVEELADADVDVLFERICTTLRSRPQNSGRGQQRHGYSRELLGNWSNAARESRSRWSGEARRRRDSTNRDRNRNASRSHAVTVPNESRAESSGDKSDRNGSNRTSSRTSDRRRKSRSQDTSNNDASNSEGSNRKRSSATASSRPSERHADSDSWRFYLSSSDSMVDAPSIGPRTAERLAKVGLNTVADLLNADVEDVATRLNYRRIQADTLRQWQAQALLACRIPQMRGHDAQILVACGVTDPDSLAELQADDLWKQIEPFVESTEGKRIIRNGKTPDLDEVRDWILWAQHARSLQAA